MITILEKSAYNSVGKIIKKINILENEKKEVWEPSGLWQGTVTKYVESVINKVKRWTIDNGYPTKISYNTSTGKSRTYYIKYIEQIDTVS